MFFKDSNEPELYPSSSLVPMSIIIPNWILLGYPADYVNTVNPDDNLVAV